MNQRTPGKETDAVSRKMVHITKEVSTTEVSPNHPDGAVSQILVQIYSST